MNLRRPAVVLSTVALAAGGIVLALPNSAGAEPN
jgi:hypothetical protein